MLQPNCMNKNIKNINIPRAWLILFNLITASRSKWRAIVHSGIYHINKYTSITRFRDQLAEAVFSDTLQLHFKTTFHLYTPILCTNKNCFVHHYYFNSLISMDILSERDLYDHSYLERYECDKSFKLPFIFKSIMIRTCRICSKNDDDKSNYYALA